MKDYTLGETVDFKFLTCEPDTGAPATLSGTPVISAYVDNSTTQITAGITLSVDFDGVTGLNNVRVVATSGNGYTTGTNVALIITTGTVDGVSAVGYKVAEFSLGRAGTSNVTQFNGTAATASGGRPEVNTSHWAGTAVASATVNANMTQISGDATAADNAEAFFDGTGYAGTNNVIPTVTTVTNAVSANVTQISGDSAAADNLEAAFDGTAGSVPWLAIIDQGTAQGGSGTTIQLRSAASFADDQLNGMTVAIVSGTGVGQSRLITDWVSATDTATVATWQTNPDNTSVYRVYPTAPATSSGSGATAQEVWEYATRVLTAGTNIALAKGTGVTGFTDLSAAQVNAEVDQALVDIHLDHLLAADYDPASPPGVSTALLNELVESDSGVSRFTVNALENGPSGSGASAEAIADEVETRTIAGVTTVGTVNALAANSVNASALAADAVTEIQSGLATSASIAALNNLSAAQVNAEVDAALSDYDPPTNAELEARTLASASYATATAVGDIPTNAELAAALGTADDAVLAAIAALNNLSAAQVNAQVVDALNTDTYAEPGQGNPGATVTLAAKIGYLYKAWRNRSTQTSSEYALYADDGTTKDQEAAVSDDGTTLVRGEVQTGA